MRRQEVAYNLLSLAVIAAFIFIVGLVTGYIDPSKWVYTF